MIWLKEEHQRISSPCAFVTLPTKQIVNMKYRPEIDGLRALAVVPVILFHAGFELFSGGFVGVDVFFVISGYLITTILIEDIENKRFSIVNFYERRARRILPALFFVMLLCIPFAWMWMLPNELKGFSESLFSVSVFLSNLYFMSELDYFAPSAELNPLLHTWSLSVEEQYYLFFPPLLFITVKRSQRFALFGITCICVVSFLFSEWAWREHPDKNFFFTISRIWELLAGSIAAFIVQKQGVQRSNLLSFIGLAAIIFSIFFYGKTTPFPSVYALVPVLGVVLLFFYADEETLAAKLLSTKAFVGIGLISYSAYLWHQPLFAFASIRSANHPSPLLMSALSAISILLAYFSWRYIEKPFRGNSRVRRTFVFWGSTATLLTFSCISIVAYIKQGFPNRIEGWETLQDIPRIETTYCHNDGRRLSRQLQNSDFCTIGNGAVEFAIIGDSHAGALFDAADGYLSEINKSAIAVSGGYCAPLLNGFSANPACDDTIQIAFDYAIESNEITTIIIAAEWANYTTGYRGNNTPSMWKDNQGTAVSPEENVTLFQRSFIRTFDALKNSGKQIIIVEPVPEFNSSPYDMMGRAILYDSKIKLAEAAKGLKPLSVAEYLKRNDDVLSIFRTYTDENIRYENTSKHFCDELNCYQFNKNGTPLYSDFNHVNYYGAQLIVEAIFNELNDE